MYFNLNNLKRTLMRSLKIKQPIIFSSEDRTTDENFDTHVVKLLSYSNRFVEAIALGFTKADINVTTGENLEGFKTSNKGRQEFDIEIYVARESALEIEAGIRIADAIGKMYDLAEKKIYTLHAPSISLPLIFPSGNPEDPLSVTKPVETTPVPEPVKVEEKSEQMVLPIPEAPEFVPSEEQKKKLADLQDRITSISLDIGNLSRATGISTSVIEGIIHGNMDVDTEAVINSTNKALDIFEERRQAGKIVPAAASSEFKPVPKTEVASTVLSLEEKAFLSKVKLAQRGIAILGDDDIKIASILGASPELIRSIKNGTVAISKASDIDGLNVAIASRVKTQSKYAESIDIEKQERARLMTEVKALLPILGTGLTQRQQGELIGLRADQISMISTGRVSHMSLDAIRRAHAAITELAKNAKMQDVESELRKARRVERERKEAEAKQQAEAVAVSKATPEYKQKVVNELRALFNMLQGEDVDFESILGVGKDTINAVYNNNLSGIDVALAESMLEYLNMEKQAILDRKAQAMAPKEVVKDLKDLASLKDLKSNTTDTKNMHSTGVLIPQFDKKYVERAKDFVKKNYTNSRTAFGAMHARYFTENKRAFGIISSNPNVISKLCGIDFQITKNIWLPAARTQPEILMALGNYLEDIKGVIAEIEEKSISMM